MLGLARPPAALVAAVLVVAACAPESAASGPAPTSQPPGSILVRMMDFTYAPNTVSAAPGRILLFLGNAGPSGHDLTVLGLDGKRLAGSGLVSPGGSSTLVMNALSPGHYRFFCSQPGHEDLGMVGSLEVT